MLPFVQTPLPRRANRLATPARAQAAQLGEGGALSVRLGALDRPQAQLDGFRTRALRAGALQASRDLYVTRWHSLELTASKPGRLLVIGGPKVDQSTRLGPSVLPEELTAKVASEDLAAVVAAMTLQQGEEEQVSLSNLEVALALLQVQAAATKRPRVWLLSVNVPEKPEVGARGVLDAGLWGLARAARAEAMLPIVCLDGTLSLALSWGASIPEPEARLRPRGQLVPRLQRARSFFANVGSRSSDKAYGATASGGHVVTGGTSGLGLLTGGWLVQRSAARLALVSRGGVVSADGVAEWEALQACITTTRLERCDVWRLVGR